jgi:hypothetical protein
VLAALLSGIVLMAPSGSAPAVSASVEAAPSRESSALRRYLTRDVPYSARFLDHGVLQVSAAGGWPHLYALRLHLGLLDHVTVGLQTHWLPDQRLPQLSPEASIAFLRFRMVEWGVHYRQTFHPPPKVDGKAKTPSFPQRDHWMLTSVSMGNHWISGGFDFGVLRARVKDPGQDPPDPDTNPSVIRWRLGGGLHLRAGTRRWGFTANVLVPQLMAELAFDVRFGLFEMRKKGGWRPAGVVYSTDRRVPPWR